MRSFKLVSLLVGSTLLVACEQPMPAATGPTYTFRLSPAQNLVGCARLDTAMSREHTVTVSGNRAIIRSAGGIDDVANQVGPNMYATDFSLGNVRLDVVADLSRSPRTLVVTEKNAGCRWQGTAA